MTDFATRFSKGEVPIWAKRYAYADDTQVKKSASAAEWRASTRDRTS